ncbi:signal peptidase I [Gordonia malaquae]|uniref:signal peptidase I n=1 Tax=Gordonia malaquae TaxID=410332 RepID=UPI0030158908
MISGRGSHHTGETAVLPDPDDVESTVDDDEKTSLLWWVKTIASWTLLCAAVALLAALVVVPRLTGSTAYTVLTGSMEPTYPPGTLIVVKPTPGADLKAGDVITFQPKSGDPSVTTHRIVSIVYDASGVRKFITKGDANNATDEPIIEEQVRGRLLYSVPKLGYLNNVMSGNTRSIAVFLIAGGLGLYALWMWISSIRDRKKPKDEDSDAEAASEPSPPLDSPSSNEWPVADVPVAPTSDSVTPTVITCPPSAARHRAPSESGSDYLVVNDSSPSVSSDYPIVVSGSPAVASGSPSAVEESHATHQAAVAYSSLATLFPAQTTAVTEPPRSSTCHACGAPAPPPAEPLADVPSTATTRPIPIIK